jgi:uncharacterized membrane protein YfcA
MTGFSLWLIVAIILIAFLCEYMDSTLGMGYGTTLTPVLMLFGFAPVKVVTAVLFSELLTGLLASFFHHREGNVNLKPTTADIFKIHKLLSPLGYVDNFKKTVPLHMKIALLLGICSIIGTVAAVFVAVNIPKFWLKLYIGVLVLSMGIIILLCFNKSFKFSWPKVISLGIIASFNKGMSGGGYGPVVTGGQILSGVESKSAVGITSFAEALTCLVGVIMYAILAKAESFDLKLTLLIITGAVLSVPLSAKSVKLLTEKKLKLAIAALTIILGGWTIIKTLNP